MKNDLKQSIISALRGLGLIKVIDQSLYFYSKKKNKSINSRFKSQNPDIKLPPDYMMYESFQLNYSSYYFDSIESAKELLNKVENFKSFQKGGGLHFGLGMRTR